MSSAQVKKITKPVIKALNEFDLRVSQKPPTDEGKNDRLAKEMRASVAIEHPHLYDIS